MEPGVTGLPVSGGVVDLRGLALSPVFKPGAAVVTDFAAFRAAEPLRKLAGLRFTNVDLTWASLPGLWVEQCAFTRVDFTGASLESWTDKANVFVDCTFNGTSFAGALVGLHGSTYSRCRFERAKFPRASFASGRFDDCEFIDCQLDGVDFMASSFERCVFTGAIDDAWFHGGYPRPVEEHERQFGIARRNSMDRVDFSRAELLNLTFGDACDLSTCIPPADAWTIHLGNWIQTVAAARRLAPASFNGEELEEIQALLDAYGTDPTQDWYIINCRAAAQLSESDDDFAQRLKEFFIRAYAQAAV